MCIRDRFDTPIINQPQVAILGTGSVVRRPVVAMTEDGGETVSYTHLRAHETVLDLVCRLLLEKKKKHTQQPNHSYITP